MEFIATNHIDILICISAYAELPTFFNSILRLSKKTNLALSENSHVYRTIAATLSCPVCISQHHACLSLYKGHEVAFWKTMALSDVALRKMRRQQGCIVAHEVFLYQKDEDVEKQETIRPCDGLEILWPQQNDVPLDKAEVDALQEQPFRNFFSRIFRSARAIVLNSTAAVSCSQNHVIKTFYQQPVTQVDTEDLLDRFLASSGGVLLAKERICTHQHGFDQRNSSVYLIGPLLVQMKKMERVVRVGKWTEVRVATRDLIRNPRGNDPLPLMRPYSQRKMFRKIDMMMLVSDMYSAVGGNSIGASQVRWFVCRICSADSVVGAFISDMREVLVAICFHYPMSIESSGYVRDEIEPLYLEPVSARIVGMCKVSREFRWI